jgi:hypothetical protein
MQYRGQLQELEEISFENFWRMYIICIINNALLFNEQFLDSPFLSATEELRAYKQACAEHGYPTPKGFTPQTLIRWVLGALPKPRIKKIKFGVGLDPTSAAPQGSLEIERDVTKDPKAAERSKAEHEVPVFIQEVHDKLLKVLDASNVSVWVMFDRLDEIFARRSAVERVALRALLRCVTSFSSVQLSLKVFLRDDVFETITETEAGFVNLTHLLSRTSTNLSWSKDQLLHLMVNRFSSNSMLRQHYGINTALLKGDPEYRERVFYWIFPDRIHPGSNQSRTLDWLMKHCEDGNGAVTPRDLIELTTFAIKEQRELIGRQTDAATLLSPASIRIGYKRMCDQKRVSYLKAEFPHFWSDIERFEGRKAEQSSCASMGG